MSSEYHADIEMMNQGSAMDLLSIDLVNSKTKMSVPGPLLFSNELLVTDISQEKRGHYHEMCSQQLAFQEKLYYYMYISQMVLVKHSGS